ncbi:MAG TPA: UvrB/UvrC motif-containing protein [Longimicrobiaceae bacterium]|nr:UvrB/UvrC motif-containing protein [Longimicrobiaceae bacterium]
MRCEQCGNDEAVIQLTTVVDNEAKVRHLCESCAAREGVDTGAVAGSAPLADFLAQMGQGTGEATVSGRCPSCGLTPAQLKQTGRLGCEACYTHFEPHLRALLRRLHGSTQHAGKAAAAPQGSAAERTARADSLRRSLRRAVEMEDFEYAATLRDQIRRLEATDEG